MKQAINLIQKKIEKLFDKRTISKEKANRNLKHSSL